MIHLGRVTSVVVVALSLSMGAAAQETAAPFQGDAVETFLREGRIVDASDLSSGVTVPQRLELEFEGRTHDAVFKNIEYMRPGITKLGDNTVVSNMQDDWRFEVAAYRIDRLLGLGMVPATIVRDYDNGKGSLQWWVESEMSEVERQRNRILPPDFDAWNKLTLRMQLFDNLIFNWDRHGNNILVTKDFEVRLIDHSRAFLAYDELRRPEELTRFSRSLLEALERLDKELLEEHVGDLLEGSKIDAMLQRRDIILDLARQAVAQNGEDAVLYP